jgi:hypothetical protein
MEKLDRIPIFFIVGRPRSGTTLLRTLFDAHPQVAIPAECKFILDLYPRYGNKTQWTKEDLEEFYLELRQQLLFDFWTIDQERLIYDLLACAGETSYSHICKVVYLNYQSFFNKEEITHFGDKNPGYTIYTRRLAKIFPGAKFIHIVRDYRDNYVSVKDVDFELPVPSAVATKWKLFYRKFERDAGKDPENYVIIRYEDLVTDPQGIFRKLCEFLDLPYHPEVFNFNEKKEEVLKAYPPGLVEKYHANLLNKVNPSRMGVWKKQLSPGEIKILDLSVGKLAEKAGYERQYKQYNPLLYMTALPGICWANFLACLTIIVDTMPYRLRMNILNKWHIKLAGFYLRAFNKMKWQEIQSKLGK